MQRFLGIIVGVIFLSLGVLLYFKNDNFVTSSNFKIDDVNVWDILGNGGYSMEPHLNGFKSYFDIFKYGVVVAKI